MPSQGKSLAISLVGGILGGVVATLALHKIPRLNKMFVLPSSTEREAVAAPQVSINEASIQRLNQLEEKVLLDLTSALRKWHCII